MLLNMEKIQMILLNSLIGMLHVRQIQKNWVIWLIYRDTNTQKRAKKQGNKICRFKFPLPPIPKTMILEPLSDNTLNENEKGLVKKNYEKINELLGNLKYDNEMNFGGFLQKLGFTEQQYIMAVR